MKLVDTHVHLASDDPVRYPKPEKPPFETIDYVNTAGQFLAKMKTAGVSRAAVVQPFGLYGDDNSYHADAARAHPARFAGVCGLSPFAEDAPARLRYWVKERGMSGLRINTRAEKAGLADPRVSRLMEEAQALGIPVTILMSNRHFEAALALAKSFPRTPVLLDHFGGAFASGEHLERLLACAAAPNLMVKFSTPQLVEGDPEQRVRSVMAGFGVERMLWGTNYPVTDLGSYEATVDASRTRLAFLTPVEQERLFGGNALSVWPALAA